MVQDEASRVPFGRPNVQSSLFPGQRKEAVKLVFCFVSFPAERNVPCRQGLITYHVVVAGIQCRRVRNRAVHDPSFGIILGTDEILNLSICRPLLALFRVRIQFQGPGVLLTHPREHDQARVSPPNTYKTLSAHLCPCKYTQAQQRITHLFALAFPHFTTLCSCSSVQASRSTDLTLLICVPMPL